MFFFKQKTANEMRISDLRSDGCSSDLRVPPAGYPAPRTGLAPLPPPPDSRPPPGCSELGGFSWAGSCRRLCVARCNAVGNPAVNFSRVPCAGPLAQLHGLREVASGDAAVDFGPRQPYARHHLR